MSNHCRPRLLVLTSTYPRWRNDPEPGFVHELSRRLTRQFDVTVLCPHAAGAQAMEVMDMVEVHRYHYAPTRWETLVNDGGIVTNLRHHPWKWLLVPGFLLAQLCVTWRLVRRLKPDVIHAHWLVPQGFMLTLLHHFVSIPPFMVTSHGADLYALRGRLATGIKRQVARASTAITVVSCAMRDEATRIGLLPRRIEVLPMGVDMQQRFVPDSSYKRSRSELLFVGRLVAKKGLPHLLQALPLVVKECPEVTLTVAGFGPEENALRIQAQQQGIQQHIKFLGALPQYALPDLYRHAALFVAPFVRDMTGDQEGLPVALMEAIACGCPVIAGEVAGIHDLLGDQTETACVRPENHFALAMAIIAILKNPDEAQERALKLRHSVASRLDWQIVAQSYSDLLLACMTPTAQTGAHT